MKKICITVLVFCMLLCSCGNKQDVTVKCEINCSDIIDHYETYDSHIPSDGLILKCTVTVKEGDGALDVLKSACKEHDIQFDVSDGYAKGIGYIYEKDFGNMSGWVYEVNNEMIMEDYTVSENDTITWKYICDFSEFGD